MNKSVIKLLSRAHLFGFWGICILLAGSQAIPSDQNCTATRDPQVLKEREEQLRATAEKLLEVFRTGDTKTFFVLVHEKYFGMGEGKNYTQAELKESFRKKDEMYCYLFDSTCITPLPEPATARELSFGELAKRPGARIRDVEVWSGERIMQPGCRGHVNYLWPAKPGENLVVPITRFTFVKKGGVWRTVGFDEPPIVEIQSQSPR